MNPEPHSRQVEVCRPVPGPPPGSVGPVQRYGICLLVGLILLAGVPSTGADVVGAPLAGPYDCVVHDPRDVDPSVGDATAVGDAPDSEVVLLPRSDYSWSTCWNGKLSPYDDPSGDTAHDVDRFGITLGGMAWITLLLPNDVACVDVTVEVTLPSGEVMSSLGTQTICDPGGVRDWFVMYPLSWIFELTVATHPDHPIEGAAGIYGIIA